MTGRGDDTLPDQRRRRLALTLVSEAITSVHF
jgi:hypothetical protein